MIDIIKNKYFQQKPTKIIKIYARGIQVKSSIDTYMSKFRLFIEL